MALPTGQVATQVTVGTLLRPFQLPRNPKVVLAPAASAPFHVSFRAVTDGPPVTTADQYWVTDWPSVKVQLTVQPLIGALPAVTRTSAWKPPGHSLITV